VLATSTSEKWIEEVDRFTNMYDESLDVFKAARLSWKEVDLARGKGRLVREKERAKTMQQEMVLSTDAEASDVYGKSSFFFLFHALMVLFREFVLGLTIT